jgi:glucose uptake protein GlcU
MPNDAAGILVGLACPLCWGSWFVPMRFARSSSRLSYASFAVFIYYFTLGVWLTLASIAIIAEYLIHSSFLGLTQISVQRLAASLLAGATWQCGNITVALTIQIAGPGFAMCCCSSLAMTLGTGLTYWISPQGEVIWLSSGVALAVAAAVIIFQMHRLKDRSLKRFQRRLPLQSSDPHSHETSPQGVLPSTCLHDEERIDSPMQSPTAPQRKTGRRVTFIIGGCSGLAVALFGGFLTLSLVHHDYMGPTISRYTCMFWFGFGVFITSQMTVPIFRRLLPEQFEDQPSDVSFFPGGSSCSRALQEVRKTSAIATCLSLFGGAVWACGFWANLICSLDDGFALAYGMGQTAPLPSILWAVIIFGEFSGEWVPSSAKVLLVTNVLVYMSAVACFVVCKIKT